MSGYGLQQAHYALRAGGAGGLEHDGLVYRIAAGALIEQAQRVAHAAVGQPGQQPGRAGGEIHALGLGHVVQAPGYDLGVQTPEVEALAAREYGRRDFAQLGRGEDEHEVLGRLLQYLEQRVEGAGGEHVHLVDYVDAFFDRGGGEDGLVTQRADVVHAVVAGRVYLHDVHDRTGLYAAAGGALAAGTAVYWVLAVHGAGEQLCAGGLARAARADEQVRVAGAAGHHLLLERLGYGLLTPDVVKRPRPVFAIQCLINNAQVLSK